MIKAVVARVRQFLAEDDGPTAVEYAVMLMLILLVVITTVQLVGRVAGAMLSDSSIKLDQALNN